MSDLEHFSSSYLEARQKFLAATEPMAITHKIYEYPAKGPEGLELYTDVVQLGPADPERLLVIVSGTHGIEGYCGSACQLQFITQRVYEDLPNGMGVLLVHSVNPYGFAWDSRTTHEGVDLNRNFMDFTAELPINAAYETIHQALVCEAIEGSENERALDELLAFERRNGKDAFESALYRGQYIHPDGNNFGGVTPTWSRWSVETALELFAGDCKHLAIMDIHTGLGPYGYGMPICYHARGSQALRRAQQWFGPSLSSAESESAYFTPVPGSLVNGFADHLSHAEVTGIIIEFGTHASDIDFSVAWRNLWLRNFGDRLSAIGKKIRQETKDYYYPDMQDWKEMVLMRSKQLIEQSIRGLSGIPISERGK